MVTTTKTQVSILNLLVGLSLCLAACGDESMDNTMEMNILDRGVSPVRLDRGMSKQDASTQRPVDMGVLDQGVPSPEVYIPYGQCPDSVDFVGQVLSLIHI